jgi:ATP-dependent RNA helicase DDX1
MLSIIDRTDSLYVTAGGLLCQSRKQRDWHGCRANKGLQGGGKYYFEVIINDEGLCRVGWSTSQV